MGTLSSLLSSATAATTGTTGTTGTTAATTSSGSGSASIGGDFNTFLSLLTTQLQNQDPTNPVDSNQFTQQLVEFAGVQQQVQSNTYLQQLVAASQSSQISSAASYVGTTVQATGDQGSLSGGTSTFGYSLPSAASNVTVTIKDASGQTVFTGSGTGNSGSNTVTWNGINSINGSTEPDGTYTISVAATNSAGTAITATPYISGTVTSASIANGTVELNIGALQVPASNVTNISGLQSASSSLASELQSL